MKNINSKLKKLLNKKNILITGGTGSFGKACTKILIKNFNLKKIIIYSRDELKQYEMAREFPQETMRFFIGDVRDSERLELATKEVDIVIHAAAMKQVPASEYNPMECIKTNVYGAENLISACIKNKVKKVIALSTDKAANPINLYGATKLCSDKLFVHANHLSGKTHSRFSVVRYGNVIGSRGSVLEYFQKLIKEDNKSLPVTHEEMTRFWMSLEDGVEFVLTSLFLMKGGETMVPKIPTIKIIDLVKALGSKLKYHLIGVRPGEKLHEILCPKDSSRETIEFKTYYLIEPPTDPHDDEFTTNFLGEKGKYVKEGFVYSSDKVKNFLSISQIKKIIETYNFTK